MGSSLGNALSAVADDAALACIRRLDRRLKDSEGTLATLKRNNVLTATGVTAGTYTYATVQVDAAGRVLSASSGSVPVVVSDVAYDATTWDGVTTVAPSKNAVRDKLETIVSNVTHTGEVTGATALTIDRSTVFTWTGVHTYSVQDIHNAGVSLGTSGVLTRTALAAAGGTPNLTITPSWTGNANIAGNIGVLIKPDQTMGANASILQIQTSAAAQLFDIRRLGPSGGSNFQMRAGFDASNYMQLTVTSTGGCGFTAVGTASGLTFGGGTVAFTATTTYLITAPTSVTLATPSLIMQDGLVISNVANATGLKIGAAGDKLGFFSVAPVVRPGAFTQTYATASHTHPNLVATAVATTASTNIAPFGYTTAAQADDIITQLNALRLDVDALKQLANAVIDDGQSLGLLQ